MAPEKSPGTAEPLLVVAGLEKRFGHTQVLRGIDLEVHRGETLGVIGPSGSGKSTLLRCVNRLVDYEGGGVWLDGRLLGQELHRGRRRKLPHRRLAAQRRAVGMVFQHFHLFENHTVLGNLCLAPQLVHKRSRAETEAHARELLTRVGLADKADRYPSQLSGGQQQRVAIARALTMRPDLLLFDEPTSALDPETVGEVLAVMRDLADSGMTMVVVTHEIGFVREAADRIAVMDDGRIIELGAPSQVLDTPAHERTRRFLRRLAPAASPSTPAQQPVPAPAAGAEPAVRARPDTPSR
ncbi:putative ABC transporter ATP-binding protein [Actinacidiphila reveromycinica]|uniref:Putative ABC transporter ATP-binding protein n=1 Tax=Actinacidiphila reveromycinica TaxID=659352 RepID=A0A7U3UMZ1_9ACTN|nr:amino acid ABC transporter ATP-binding protein [Streptomyces sp. SN-593]BBA95485.1 putative ABC transporter ATP-binding protein [Streptomyces sp. SN-593]